MLKQNNTRKLHINKKSTIQLKFNSINYCRKYEVRKILESKVYVKEFKANYLLEVYYFVF